MRFYKLAPRPSPPYTGFTLSQYAGRTFVQERGGRGWGRSQIIGPQEILVVYKSFNILWGQQCWKCTHIITGFIRGILRGVRYAKSLRVLFLHRRSPSWTTLVLYSRAVFIFNEPTPYENIIPCWRGEGGGGRGGVGVCSEFL